MKTKPVHTYRAYLLRFWREKSGWRASLENPHTGEYYAFASVRQLAAYLEDTLDEPICANPAEEVDGSSTEEA